MPESDYLARRDPRFIDEFSRRDSVEQPPDTYATEYSESRDETPAHSSVAVKRKGKDKDKSKGKEREEKPEDAADKDQTSLCRDVSAFFKLTGSQKTGSYVSVKNMYFSVPGDKKSEQNRIVLKDISFYLRPGMMCLLLGNPGGGRSSLLKILANVTPSETHVSGQLLYNNHRIDPKTHHRNVSYITQLDNHLPTLTVKETLQFSSKCIVPKELSSPEADKQRVELLLRILRLEKCKNTLMGNEFIRGISGGEKKRVTVGVDLMKGSDVILMDEPTTGLDSVTTVEIMESIRALTDAGNLASIVALLQPPKEAFELFDTVMVLCDGEIAYFGPRELAVPYFENLGFVHPEEMNPAEFLQEVVTYPGEFTPEGEEIPLATAAEFAAAFKETEEFADIMSKVTDPAGLIPDGVQPKDATGKPTHIISSLKQFQLCLSRAFKITTRNRVALMSRFLKVLFLGVVLGTLFINIGTDQNSISQRPGLIFFSSLQILFASLITIRDLYDQRPVFFEQRDLRKWYTTGPYFLAYIIPELLLGIAEVAVFSVIVYWLVDFQGGSARFLFFLLDLYAVELIGFSFIVFISAVTPSSVFAGTLVPAVELLFILCAGFLVSPQQIPGWWIWLFWASPLHYAFEGLLINEFHGLTFHCSPGQLEPPIGTGGFGGAQTCPTTSGTSYLGRLGFHQEFYWRWIDLIITFGFALGFLFIAFLALRFYDQTPRSAGIKKFKSKDKKRFYRRNKRTKDTEVAVDLAQQEHPDLRVYGAYLTFSHVHYYVQGSQPAEDENGSQEQDAVQDNGTGSKEIRLLTDVSGYVKPGTLLALMGASGAGKSTLLDVLAGRKESGRITGEILINGNKPDITYTRYTAYVTQTDILFPTYTVGECVRFSAMCRLPEAVSAEEKTRFAEQILIDLDLKKIENKVVGMPGSGISPEQRKRLNLAVELAANPQLIFLDEPTTGLDSAAARKVMNLVKKLTLQGRSVICTIHQPSLEIFKLFDALLLLTHGGKTVYFGPTGENGDILMEYTNRLGYEMEQGRNIADYALEFAAGHSNLEAKREKHREEEHDENAEDFTDDATEAEFKSPASLQEIVASFNQSTERRDVINEISNPDIVPPDFNPPRYNGKYASSFKTQFNQNTKRAFISLWKRRTLIVWFQVGRMLFYGVFMGTIFINNMDLDQSGITNRVSHIFFSCLFGGFIGFALIPMIVQERGVFYHEQASGSYRPTTYALATILAIIPLVAVTSLIFMFPAYWIPGFDPRHDFSRFLFYLLLQFLSSITLVSLSHVLAVAAPAEGIAVMLLGLLAPLMLLFAGFFVPRTQIPGWWIWGYWISFLHYAVESTTLETLKGLTFHCIGNQFIDVTLPSGEVSQYCATTTFQQIVHRFGLLSSWKWIDVGVLFGIYFIFTFIILFVLAKVRHTKT